jgi:hypothetical protein
MTAHAEHQSPPRDALFLHVHPPRHGLFCCVFELGEFPVKPVLLRRWLELYSAIRPMLFGAGVKTICALQMWHIHHNDGSAVLSKNGSAWRPEFGVGVWLDQPPPTLWSPEEFEMLGPGDLMRPPILSAIRLRAEPLDHQAVWNSMGGRGAYLELAVSGEPEVFLADQAPLYRRWIEEEIIQVHPFFVPLLSAASLRSELLASRLVHVDPVTAYARESQEDRGLVVLTREPFEQRIASVAALVPWSNPDPEVRSFLVQSVKAPAR